MKGIKKYYIGLTVLAVLTLGLLVYVLSQGSAHKHDKEINEAATKIADDLNSYIQDEQKIPAELSEATDETVPDEIKYKLAGDDAYELCITYSGSSGPQLDSSSIISRGLSGNYAYDSYDYESSYTPSSLYISTYSWSAGEKCYKVKPIIYSYRSGSGRNSSLDYVCEETYIYYEFYKDSCEDGLYQYDY